MNKGLYDSSFEHDNCGIGAVVNIKGVKTHMTVSNALKIVEQLEHRAGKDAKGETGDGVGILTQIPYTFFKKKAFLPVDFLDSLYTLICFTFLGQSFISSSSL